MNLSEKNSCSTVIPEEETTFTRLYREDLNFRIVADVAKGNGWSEQSIVEEYMLDLQAQDE